MQLHSYQHSQYPDDFPLNTDDHHHIHQDMNQQNSPLKNYSKTFDFTHKPEQGPEHSR
jgi:hypothetical protein